jgi:hypothetical protein
LAKFEFEQPPKIASLVRCGCCRMEWEPKPKKGFRDNGTTLVQTWIVDCPRCGRRYKQREDGVWFSDRELIIVRA